MISIVLHAQLHNRALMCYHDFCLHRGVVGEHFEAEDLYSEFVSHLRKPIHSVFRKTSSLARNLNS